MWFKLLCLGVYTCVHVCADIVYTEEKEDFYDVVGIFEKEANVSLLAFKDSMKAANKGALRLKPWSVVPSKADSYSVWKDFCSNNTAMPIAVVGPPNPFTDGAIRDQCTKAHIPHIQAAWQPVDPDMFKTKPKLDSQVDETKTREEEEQEDKIENQKEDTDEEPTFKPISINFYPDADELSEAHVQLLKFYEWEMFAVLYEDDFGLMRIQKILAGTTTTFPITVRRLDPDAENHDEVLKEVLKVYDEGRILLDCHVDNVMKYLSLAKKLNLLDLYQHIVLTTMDASIIAEELEAFPPNITWLSISQHETLTDPQHSLVARVGEWVRGDSRISNPLVTAMKTEALMMDDIANHLLKAMENITDFRKPSYYPCDKDGEPWDFGARLQDQLLKTESRGATGQIKFDDRGRRTNYTLYVNEKSMLKRHTIGKWESEVGGPIQRFMVANDTTGGQNQPKKKFIIIARIAEPYFFEKKKEYDENGELIEDDQFEGFSVDLIKKIFESLKTKMGLEYSYEFRHEKKYQDYGEYDPETKKWTGLIGALLDKKADMAVCDITITERRKSVVDFSVPFMTLGISILYVKEHKVNPGTFSFMYPYEFEVWIYTATAYCVVSIILFVCSRISPADWENPQPCDKDPEELENIWNFKNCAWMTMGSIMTQGCDILPKAIGSRWVCGMWWFFAMIVCQTYIAQLSASMTSALESEPINSVEDLAKQTKIRYGALRKGATFEFFRNSQDKIYQKIYTNMVKNDVVLVGSNDEGEKRVINGNNKYAYFMESSTIEYKLKRNCALKQIGGTLDSKDYGIAMPANSPFRSQINAALLDLKELNILEEIKRKYWENSTYGALDCDRDGPDKDDVEGDLEMENLIGAFLVLIVGLVFCLFITAAEFMNEVRNIVVREQLTHKEAFVQELKASLNLMQLQKPVLRNPSRAPSLESSESEERHQVSRIALNLNFMELEKQAQ